MPARPRSPFSTRLDRLVARWTPLLPPTLRKSFQEEVRSFGDEYDSTLDTIEDIWRRREHDYAIDETTGLARRRPFLDYLVTLLETPETPLFRAVGVLFIDVDRLKRINDSYGHEAGDRAVAAAGAIIRDTIRADRSIDFMSRNPAGAEYAVSRHGGDEFMVALELKNAPDVQVVAERLKRWADNPQKQRAHGYDCPAPLTVSVGGVVYALASAPPAFAPHVLARNLVSAADQEMYKAKKDGLVHVTVAGGPDHFDLETAEARLLS